MYALDVGVDESHQVRVVMSLKEALWIRRHAAEAARSYTRQGKNQLAQDAALMEGRLSMVVAMLSERSTYDPKEDALL
jgi:hypothetical protein